MPRSIVLAVETSAPATVIHDAIATTEGLRSFWTIDADAEEGGELRFGFEAAPVDLTMTVAELEPHKLVRWSRIGPWPGWADTEIVWRITDGGESRIVTFRHDGWADETPDHDLGTVAMTWAHVMDALKQYTETGRPAPVFG